MMKTAMKRNANRGGSTSTKLISRSSCILLFAFVLFLPTSTSFSTHSFVTQNRRNVHAAPALASTPLRLRIKKEHKSMHRPPNHQRSYRTALSQTDIVSSWFLVPTTLTASTEVLSANAFLSAAALPGIDASGIARGLGYLVGTGAVLLYTPIAVRIVRQQSADGLTLSTWWLKLASYTCSILYNVDKGYPPSTYAETSVLAAEAATILVLVAYFQNKLFDAKFLGLVGVFGAAVAVLLNDQITPPEVLALGQGGSALINVLALLPQFALNARTQTTGDYSPVTAGLAATGCAIRLFTTVQLAGSDPLLLGSFGIALVLNASLLLQILYYGIKYEGKSLGDVLAADYASSNNSSSSNNNNNNNSAATMVTTVTEKMR